MECNREEATRAKEIADRKFSEREYVAAKKFVLKAQSLYPGLEGLSQMMMILDVHIASKTKINGEADWYGILGVNHIADDETIKKGYRKLAFALHPDKNKCLGADEAFKVVSEAWSLLSDKAKRLAYNQRRFFKGSQQKIQTTQGGVPKAPFRANDIRTSNNNAASKYVKTQKDRTTMFPQPNQRPTTFWTICKHCKTQYEYLRIYLSHTLLCPNPNCKKSFNALETAPPPANVAKSFHSSDRQLHQSSNHHATNNTQLNSVKMGPAAQSSYLKRPANHDSYNCTTGSQPGPPSRKPAIFDPVMRMGSTRLSADYLQNEDALKKRRMVDDVMKSHVSNMVYGHGNDNSSHTPTAFNFSFHNNRHNGLRELSPLEIRNMLMEKARLEINEKTKAWRLAAEIRAAEKGKVEDNKKEKTALNANANDSYNFDKPIGSEKRDQSNKSFHVTFAVDSKDKEEAIEPMPMNVPDSDFHSFDMDRTEISFAENQVWAAYDEDDGMPRYYAIIHKVISLKPFKIKMSWLNAKINTEFSSLDWTGSGFNKTCGHFRVGRHEVYKTLNSFSHMVTWTKSRGVIHIYPKKGDVWALYRNWCPEWNESTPDEVIHKYDMVEVLDDYDEEQGLKVCPLIKVVGFRAVFHVRADLKDIMNIPKEEMFRLSHQIPKYTITGEEAPNAPKGFCELDPAATPLELLEILTDANAVKIQ